MGGAGRKWCVVIVHGSSPLQGLPVILTPTPLWPSSMRCRHTSSKASHKALGHHFQFSGAIFSRGWTRASPGPNRAIQSQQRSNAAAKHAIRNRQGPPSGFYRVPQPRQAAGKPKRGSWGLWGLWRGQ